VAAFNFTFNSLITIPRALLVRKMELRRVAILDFCGAIVSMSVSTVMAIWVRNAWPLLIGPLIGQGTAAGLYIICSKWRPRLRFRVQDIVGLARVGIYVTGFIILNYLSRNFDNLLIGKWLGAEPLAFYARAYSLMLLPITLINQGLAEALTSMM